MPLNATNLAQELNDALAAATYLDDPDTRQEAEDNLPENRMTAVEIIAETIINHFKTNALITGVCPSMGGPLASGRII